MALKRRLRNNVAVVVGTAAAVDGTSGTAVREAGPGSLYARTATNVGMKINRGTKASPTWEPVTKTLTAVVLGRNGAGAVTVAGTLVGDKVITAVNLTDATNDAAKFEAVVTVAGQIQQSDAGDLSAKKIMFQVAR